MKYSELNWRSLFWNNIHTSGSPQISIFNMSMFCRVLNAVFASWCSFATLTAAQSSASFIEIFEFWVSNLQPLSQHETKALMSWGLWEHIPKVCSCARATPKKLWARRRAESYLQIASVGWHWGCRSGGINGNATGSVVKRCHEALVFWKHTTHVLPGPTCAVPDFCFIVIWRRKMYPRLQQLEAQLIQMEATKSAHSAAQDQSLKSMHAKPCAAGTHVCHINKNTFSHIHMGEAVWQFCPQPLRLYSWYRRAHAAMSRRFHDKPTRKKTARYMLKHLLVWNAGEWTASAFCHKPGTAFCSRAAEDHHATCARGARGSSLARWQLMMYRLCMQNWV